ncbi:monovalent cation:proton antiporter-2 (CPA2) family protein [Legionella sp. CNM-4043-24]|uniref:monovalent cation:proton antiporter-2 (CPA2) family protein n=1 Tax=Legionella sp. CNM-4043-24 TaxID=3421646 RepID=UPI00403AF90C
MTNNFLYHVFIFLGSACLIVPLASRFKLGSVLGYLVIGVLIGPFGFQLIGNAAQIMHFAEFGVIMMLFLIGLELEPETLWRLRRVIVGLGGLQVLISTVVLTLIGMAFHYDWRVSLTVSMALSLSSTALVIQMLQEKNLMQTTTGETSFAVLLFQDISVIFILLLIPLLAAPGTAPMQQDNLLAAYPGWAQTLIISAIIAAVVLAGHYLSHYFFYMIAKTNLREVFTATSLAVVVGITLLMQEVGVSPGLGAFIAGVVLANSDYKRTLETDIEPFKGLLLGLFFISVGMGINFTLLADKPMDVLGVVSLLVLVKAGILFALCLLFRLSRVQSFGIAMILSQGSEFAFVLFQFARSSQVINENQAGFYTLVVAISMASTPLLSLLYNRLILPRFMSRRPEAQYDEFTEQGSVILAGYGRFGQVIGRFLSAQGVSITVLESNPEQIESLRKFGIKGYYGDAGRLDILHNAGAAQARLLIVAVDDPDTCMDIVRLAKSSFPNLAVFARARNRRHAYELDKVGVDYFKREVFDSSLSMAQDVMKFLGFNPDSMKRKARAFAQHDELVLKKSFEFFEQEQELISFARQARGELDQILQDDQLTGSRVSKKEVPIEH